ncbi:transglutaminase-like domain-containing protein [Anaerolineales bacterium HSG24]|nr:transglutaminase-like domain-containing protein [Anaerolineales bacterium HSG24]
MTNTISNEMQDFYSSHSCVTDPGKHSTFLDGLPSDVPELVKIVHGIILHIHWAESYKVYPSEERKQDANLRFVSKQLEQIKKIEGSALHISRPLESRLLGTCRDYSVFLSALLRHQGIPARARCGFANYFTPGKYEDHWVCEYWKADEQRWVMVDAQLDEHQIQTIKIDFNPLDLPTDKFFPGGRAWQMCRMGQADPNKFGIFDMYGLWFIRGNVVRDVASLNKMELLPWDCWGLSLADDDALSNDDFALLDRVAPLTLPDNFSFSDLSAIYKHNKGLTVPPVISTFIVIGGKMQKIDLSEDCASIL